MTGEERIQEFEKLAGDLYTYFPPVGTLEEILVERIAVCFWRLKRALRCESGLSARGLYEHQEKVAEYRRLTGLERRSDNVTGHLSLPGAARMNLLLRYETTIQRQLDGTLDRLERVQRERKGEYVPAAGGSPSHE